MAAVIGDGRAHDLVDEPPEVLDADVGQEPVDPEILVGDHLAEPAQDGGEGQRANFLVTQPIFDVEALESFLARLGPIDVPVLAELMPLRSFEQAEYVHYELPDTRVPEAVLDRLRAAGPDGPAAGQALTAAFLGECGDLVNGAIVVPTAGSPNETAELVRTLVGTIDTGPR